MNVPDQHVEAGPSGGLYRRLLWSHLSIAGIAVVILVLALALILTLRAATVRAASLRGPTACASTLALEGVQRSLAALRGWIALGNDEFKAEREVAWQQEIEPAMEELRDLSQHWPDADRATLREIGSLLQRLKKTQWWIEDVAQTPGNDPARAEFELMLKPVSIELERSVLELVRFETDLRAAPHVHRVANDLRFHFMVCQSLLWQVIDLQQESSAEEFQQGLQVVKQCVDTLSREPSLSECHADLLGHVQDELPAYEQLANALFTARENDCSNVALCMLRDEAVPKARRATELLTTLSRQQAALMKEDGGWAMSYGDRAIGFALLLVLGMVTSAMYVSRQGANALVEPIVTLSAGTQQLARGFLDKDLPVTSADELGDLTRSFNQMRAELERRTAELATSNTTLRDLEERLRVIVDSAPVAMVMVKAAGEIALVNAQAERLFGYSREELLGQQVEALLPERFRTNHLHQRLQYMQAPESRLMNDGRELQALHRSGDEIPVEIGISVVETTQDQHILSTIVDITHRKQMQAAMQEANESLERSNQELEQFAYVASHDLQEPLRKIAAYCQLLKEEHGEQLDGQGQQYLDIAISGAERLRTLVQDLLAFSRITTRGKELAPTSANDTLRMALENLEFVIQENGAQVTADPLPVVLADDSQLTLLFQNLIGNAIKYRRDVPPEIHITSRKLDDNYYEFFVRDNGIGIEADYHARIFEIFQRLHNRRSYSGTGIGLAVCKRIVERFGGRIWVESTADVGSTFYFTLRTPEMVGATDVRQLYSARASDRGLAH